MMSDGGVMHDGTEVGDDADRQDLESHVCDRIRDDPFALIDTMPVAMFVIDSSATVIFCNDRTAEMVGATRAELVGRSALDLIDSRDMEFALSLLDAGPAFRGTIMGPSRIRYVDRLGVSHQSQFWAHEAPTSLGIDGFVITLTPESVRDVLGTALGAVASDEPLDRTLSAIATAGRAAPLGGIGSILLVEPLAATDAERFRLIGDWPVDPELINGWGTPWRTALVERTSQDIVDCSLPGVDARTGASMAVAGHPSCCVRPVFDAQNEVAAVLVIWRRTRTNVSPNQEAHIGDAIRLAHFAIEQSRHRVDLERAAHRDALTGVGNRASLNDRIVNETEHPNVLFIDFDDFKAVNDTFGHHVGDEVIAQAGRRIGDAVRRSDDVYRIGGDEFVVVCESESGDDADELHELAMRIIERLRAPVDCREHRVRIGATVGIASGRPAAGRQLNLQEAIHAADRAMYVAKERGGFGIQHADPDPIL